MLIKDWMATTILTVDANTSVMRATRIMKENNIRRLPVLSHGKLVGIVTDRDLKEASPLPPRISIFTKCITCSPR